MDALRKASAALFYALGALFILLIVLVRRGSLGAGTESMLNALDLPLLFIAMLFGGSSLYMSLSKGEKSLPLLLVIFVPLGILFVVFCLFNFGMPVAELI